MRAFLILLTTIFVLSSTFASAETANSEPTTSTVSDPLAVPHASPVAADKTDDLLLYALSLNGTRYKYGGNDTDTGFDCSGFVRYVYGQVAGLALPRNTRSISRIGTQIVRSELKPGDLVFFNTLRRAFSHVGIYLGDNRFIHASSSTSGDVTVSDLNEKYWSKRFNGARRFALSE